MLYLKNVLGKEVTMITHSKIIRKFCEDEHINHIDFEKIMLTVTSLHKIFALKKTLDDLIKKIDAKKEDGFFLTGNAKGYGSFYLAKELSKKGFKVWYKATDLEGREMKRFKPPWYKPIFIRGGIIRILLKIFLDLDLIYYDAHTDPCFGITDDFLKKYNIKEYDPEHSAEELIFKGLKASNKKFKEYDNLIMDQGPLVKIIEFDSLKRLNEKILELPIKFAFKKYPNSLDETEFEKNYFKLFKRCKELPDYIPVELLLNNIQRSVISVISTSLITASKFDNLKTISLLELVKWHNKKTKEEWRQTLSKASKNKILFPTSFEELEKLLLN